MKIIILLSLMVMSCSYDVKSIKCYSDDKVIYESNNVYSLMLNSNNRYTIIEKGSKKHINVSGNCIVEHY
jgi:hypothetical protein